MPSSGSEAVVLLTARSRHFGFAPAPAGNVGAVTSREQTLPPWRVPGLALLAFGGK